MDEDEQPSFIGSMFETFGSISIGLAATVCSGIAHVRSSPTLLATLIGCLVVLFPFLCAAGVILTIGLICCIPIVVIGVACVSIPALLRQAKAAASKAGHLFSGVRTYAQENPVLVAGAGLCVLPLLPVILVCR